MSYYTELGYPAVAVIESLMTIINSNYEEWHTANPDKKFTDFELPEYCPILGLKIEYGSGDGNAPNHASLDRIDNSKGYIPGNVMIVSRLANAMKNEANFNQLQSFITNYSYLLNYINEHGTLGNITDIFPHWKKLSLDS